MTRVVALFGAGFAAEFGVPTMHRFFEAFVLFSRRRYPGLTETLDKIVQDIGGNADIEALLSRLNSAVMVASGLPPDFNDPSVSRWTVDCAALRAHLLSFIVERCEKFDGDRALSTARPLLEALAQHQASIFTTNYDRILEHICEEAGIELDDGFVTSVNEPVAAWSGAFQRAPIYAKIHGSVTWYEDPQEDEGFMRLDRGYPLPGQDFHLSRGTHELRPLMIIPTLEKDALTRPYMRLLTLLSDALQSARLVLTVGSSLRDQHLAELIRARADTVCVVVVSRDADTAAARLPGVRVIPFSVTTRDLLAIPATHLDDLFALTDADDPDARAEGAARFVEREQARLATIEGLTKEQSDRLALLQDGSHAQQLLAIDSLRAVAHPDVMNALLKATKSDSPDVRSAAAGSLGQAMQSDAVDALAALALHDDVPLVRVEAVLALRRIGTDEATAAVAAHFLARPEDLLPDAM